MVYSQSELVKCISFDKPMLSISTNFTVRTSKRMNGTSVSTAIHSADKPIPVSWIEELIGILVTHIDTIELYVGGQQEHEEPSEKVDQHSNK